jgi:hypothetical protein
VAKGGPAKQGGPPVQRLELAGVRRSALVGLGVAILVPVAIVAWIIWGVGGSKSASGTAGGTHGHRGTALAQRTSAHTENPLMKAVDGINVSMTAKGMLPPSTCKVMSSTMVSCTNPTPAIDTVTFQSFRTLDDLYSAYVKRVSQLAQAPFHANFGDCTETSTSGETGWNHNFKHPSMYPLSDFTSGRITDDEAAGRVYCTFDNSMLHLVWTQDDGDVLGELSGAPHLDAYVWWRQIHHSVVLPGFPGMNMQQMKQAPKSVQSMMSTTSTTSTTMK